MCRHRPHQWHCLLLKLSQVWLAAGQQDGAGTGCTALPGWLVSSGRGAFHAAALADRGVACHAPAHEAWHIPAAAGCSRILSWWVATACLFLAITMDSMPYTTLYSLLAVLWHMADHRMPAACVCFCSGHICEATGDAELQPCWSAVTMPGSLGNNTTSPAPLVSHFLATVTLLCVQNLGLRSCLGTVLLRAS